MPRRSLGLGGLALAILLAGGALAEDAVGELEASADEACVAGCNDRHDDCVRTAQSTRDDCERKRRACDDTCAPCLALQGPPVVYCVQECENCRAQLSRTQCAPSGEGRASCERTRKACLADCRP